MEILGFGFCHKCLQSASKCMFFFLTISSPPMLRLSILNLRNQLSIANNRHEYYNVCKIIWKPCQTPTTYTTVDGRNPAPPGMYKSPKKWDKLPMNWCRISAINSMSCIAAFHNSNWHGVQLTSMEFLLMAASASCGTRGNLGVA